MASVTAAGPVTARFRLAVRMHRIHYLGLHKCCSSWRSPSSHRPKFDQRRSLIHAVNQDAEKAFKKTLQVDRLIDLLRDSSNPRELEQLVVENVLAFNESFWIRLAARTDTCKSEDDKAWFFTGWIMKNWRSL